MKTRARSLSVRIEEWATKVPLRITGYVWNCFRIVVVEVTDGHCVGRGEGVPVYYLGESAESLSEQVESLIPKCEQGLSREDLLTYLPAGGARNAVDAALWDLEAKSSGRTIWEICDIEPRSLKISFTIGLEDTPEEMAARALESSIYPVLKIKLNRDRPVERVRAIRNVRPEAALTVDANQGWDIGVLKSVAPALAELGVLFIEQPLPRGNDAELSDYLSPIPLCADESCQHEGELEQAASRYQIINIKLDKVGGLTAGRSLAAAVRARRLQVLVSCMGGTSLSMAAAYVLAQEAKFVELDCHLMLKHDRYPAIHCTHGELALPPAQLWG